MPMREAYTSSMPTDNPIAKEGRNILTPLVLFGWALMVAGCGDGYTNGPGDPLSRDTGPADDTDSETATDTVEPFDTSICLEAEALPSPSTVWMSDESVSRPSAADIVFDAEGHLITADGQGNLIRHTADGERSVWLEDMVKTPRGMAFLSTGELVIADSGISALVKVRPDGTRLTLLSHLDHPSGIEVDLEDFIYVAELRSRTIRKVDPVSGASEPLVRSMGALPSGLAFAPDYKTLYFTGFADGAVYAMSKNSEGGFGAPEKLATVPGQGDPCEGKAVYDSCGMFDMVLGVCTPDGDGGMYCQKQGSCEGADEGDSCRDSRYDREGSCVESGEGELFCDPVWPCSGKETGDECSLYREYGYDDFGGVSVSDGGDAYSGDTEMMDYPVDQEEGANGVCEASALGILHCVYVNPCEGLTPDDECTTDWGEPGVCVELGDELHCEWVSPCRDKSPMDECTTDWGEPGICIDEGYGELYCDTPGPCFELDAFDSCTTYWGEPGICVEDRGYAECLLIESCEARTAGDACTTEGDGPGVCTDAGNGALVCLYSPPCEGLADGDDCTTDWGAPGRCVDFGGDWPGERDTEGMPATDTAAADEIDSDDPFPPPPLGGLYCQEVNTCDGLEEGDECEASNGAIGTCSEWEPGYLECDAPPLCREGLEGESCGTNGTCTDDLEGALYCQNEGPCRDMSEGAACLDPEWWIDGVCVSGLEGALYCQLDNECRDAEEGTSCEVFMMGEEGVCAESTEGLRYCARINSCTGKAAGDHCTTGWDTDGVCIDFRDEGMYCMEPGPCGDKEAGDACEVEEGGPGICQDYHDGYLFCEPAWYCDAMEPGDPCTTSLGETGVCQAIGGEDEYLECMPVTACFGKTEGDACIGAVDIEGTCEDEGGDGLVCRLPPPCEDKAKNDPCQNPQTGASGRCREGAAGELVCQPKSPCRNKAAGDACGLGEEKDGVCIDPGQGDELWCYEGDWSGQLNSISTDICGNIYVTDALSDAVWRVRPDGEPVELVTNALTLSVTGAAWGSGAEGWDAQTLYLAINGGAEVVSVPVGLPEHRRAAVQSDPDIDTSYDDELKESFDCLSIPDEPISITELDAPRGYHDLAFDDEGFVVGWDGFSLVRVSRDDEVQLFSPGFASAEGMAWLPDGSLVVATFDEGLVVISPNGAKTTLASDIMAYGVTVGPDGLIYTADNSRLYRVDPATGDKEVLVSSMDYAPRGVNFDPDFTLMYITSLGRSDVYVVPLDDDMNLLGDPMVFVTIPGSGFQDGLGVDICGNLYVPDYDSSSLYRISPEAEVKKLVQWEFEFYGHGLRWGSGIGGFDDHALYLPQPYDDNTVVEVDIGVPSNAYGR